MDQVVNLADFDPALSKLIDRMSAGEEVVLERGGKPVARLVHVQEESSATCRVPGMLKHLIGPEPEGFFDPLTEEELKGWYGDDEPDPLV